MSTTNTTLLRQGDFIMAEETAAVEKKRKKLGKVIEGSIVTITEGITGSVLKFDFNTLPAAIQTNFGPFGLGHKLGDAAAGRKGQEAVDAINKVWEGLVKGDWTIRMPASEKVSKRSILEKYNEMPEGKEKSLAQGLLQKLGLL